MHTTEDLVRQTAAFFIHMHKKKMIYQPISALTGYFYSLDSTKQMLLIKE